MVIEEHAALDVITKDGSTYAIDESQIIRGSLTTSQSCSSGGGIPAGSCNTGTASVAFHAPSALSYEKLFGAKVKLYVWYGDASKKQVGVYNVTSTERSYGVYTLSLSDNVYLLDEACYSNDTTTDAQNWLAMQLGEKRVPSVIFNMICNSYDVPHWNASKNEKAVPESGIDALSVKVPSDCCTESVKDFANYLAEYLGAIIMPDENGELHFAYMGSRTCPITIDASNIERDTYQKSPFHVSTSSWRVNHDSGIWTSWSVSGDFPDNAAPLSIVVNNNPFWQSVEDGTPESMVRGRTETMLRYMWVAQGKVAYIDNMPQINPFRCTVHVPYYFRAGDRVKIIDPITLEEYHSYVTDVTWTFRGGQQISCAGEDTRTLSVSTSRNGAKKMSDYSRYLYRKSKSDIDSGDANTYTKAEIDAKDAAVKSVASKAQETADGAVSVNNTQNTQITALQKSAHTHSNKGVLDKTEQPYTTAERDKLAGLENYTHPTYAAHAKGFYKFASDDEGHVTAAEKVTKKDITDLGIPGEDTNTTYKLELPTYTNPKEPPAPMLSLNGSDGSENKQTIPCAYTVLDDIVYKKFSGFKIGSKYRSVADLAFVKPGSARIYPWRIIANISLETPSGSTYIDLHYTLEITDEGSSIRRYLGNGKYYSGNSCTTNDWAILSDLQNFSNPDRDVWLYRIGVPDDVFNKLTNAYCEARLVYQTGKNGDVVKPVSYYKDITFDENVHAMDTDLVYVLTKADVSDVAFTGSYNDLANKPTIPDGSKFLPLSGGKMTGDIDMATNGKDIVVGAHRSAAPELPTAVAGGTVSKKLSFETGLPERKSLIGSWLDQNSVWHNILSVRHRNGWNDGPNYGFYLRSLLTSDGSLFWNKQTGANTWQGERALLDSTNYTSYAAKSDHTHAMIVNSQVIVNGANANPMWVRLGTLVSSGNFYSASIRVWTGSGANGNAFQNSSFEIQIKDGWQSTESAVKACGVTVYRINCSAVKVKVIPTAHNTYVVWAYLPWGYWNGNFEVRGKYTSWTPQVLRQPAEPDGTTADTAYFDHAFLTSTVAKATEATALTDSGWQKPTFPSGVKSSSIRYRKQGKIVSVTGYVQFSAAQTTITVLTLPTGYRPPAKIQQFNAVDSSAQASFLTKIDTDGKVGFFGKTQGFFTTATEYYIHCTFFVD